MLGLLGNWNLLLVALFVFVAARSEADAVAEETVLEEPPAGGEGPANTIVLLPAHARVDEAATALFSPQYFFPVIQAGEMVGVLSKAELLRARANDQGDRLVAELMAGIEPPSRVCCAIPARCLGQHV